jgi:hypothetical protein
MGPGHFDHAKAGAAQGRIYANNNLRPGGPGTKAALKNGLGGGLGTAQARLELLELAGRDGHVGRGRGGVPFSIFRPELKTKSPALATFFADRNRACGCFDGRSALSSPGT